MQVIEIGAQEIMAGTLFNDNLEGAGLSPTYKGHNFFRAGGAVMYPQPVPTLSTVSGTTLSADIVASIVNPAYLGDDAIMLDADGKFYFWDGDVLTFKQQDTTNSFANGNTDIKFFSNNIFATSQNNITQVSLNMTSIDPTWWTVTKGKGNLNNSYRHPMEIVEDSLYIADDYKIHMIDISLNATENWLQLPSVYNITALCKHPNGVYLLAFCAETANYSHTQKSKGKIFVIDVTAGEFVQEIDVDDQTEGAINVGGIIYVTYGKNLGYFTGSGYKLLRKLNLPTNKMVYTQNLSSIGNVLLVPEFANGRKSILAYGDVNGKGNIFFYPFDFYEANSSTGIANILNVYPNSLLVCYVTASGRKLYRINFEDTTNNGNALLTHKRTLQAGYWVRRVDLYVEAPSADATLNAFIFEDYSGQTVKAGAIDYGTDGAISFKRMDCNIRIKDLQLLLNWGSTYGIGFKKALIYVEPE